MTGRHLYKICSYNNGYIKLGNLTPQEIIKKHKPLTKEDLEKYKKISEERKAKYSMEMETVEANLLEFLKRPRPVLDPETKVPILWIRDVTFNELKQMIPPEMAKYVDNPEAIDPKKLEEYDNRFYKIISDLIVIPKHNAEWWKKHMNSKLARLIQDEIAKMLEDMGVEMENFRKARKGKP